MLGLIAEKPRHGYEIIKEIEDRLAGSYSPSPGVVYPTLTLLEELGHAEVTESDGKKCYAITEEGTAFLAANQATVDAALARMSEVRAVHGGGPAPQIVRAIENLKLALRLRQARGPLTQVQINVIAEALDSAAIAIERS
ncbi:PadR family transcriptional regulator [Acidocella sp.]|uniref:PadR family transcriptional regulator n=1 Tax=Acidocella sp. TaxID=50710 RepID=UPI002F40B1E7